jgi:hypothetical protein
MKRVEKVSNRETMPEPKRIARQGQGKQQFSRRHNACRPSRDRSFLAFELHVSTWFAHLES